MHLGTFIYLVTGSLVTLLLKGAAGLQNDSATYPELYVLYFESTPVFQNVTGKTANPLLRVLHGAAIDHPLKKRVDNGLPIGTCAPGTPCSNGACCSKTGVCGFSPDQCGPHECISNCDAKAECGQYAPAGAEKCPINVCCSKFGFCGTIKEFCGNGCQTGFGGCGAAKAPSCGGQGATQRTIGYYEGAATRACDKRLPSDLDVSGLTHINFVFAYFHPMTFEVLPMSGEDTALYPQFTALKAKKPSLKAWISIGGWAFNDATNSPNTQTAFSEMAGSAASRAKFTQSILSFMSTWGFDGVDFDWEYPGADDRGGVKTDTGNFVLLLKDAPKRP